MTKKETELLTELVQEIQQLKKTIEHYSEYAYQWSTCVKAMTSLYDSNLKMIEWKNEDNEELKKEIKRLSDFQLMAILKN